MLSGSGEGGASAHMAGEAAMGMRTMFDTVREATGIDLSAMLQGQAIGHGIANGRQQEAAPNIAETLRRDARQEPQERQEQAPDEE